MPAETMSRSTIHGHIAARIDRLPLTRVQWHLAILVEVTWDPNHLGWIVWIVLPGALVPAALIWGYGIKQSRAVLEQVST